MGSRRPVVLGIEFDLDSRRANIRPTMASEIKDLIAKFVAIAANGKAIPRHLWDTLTGKLSFVLYVYPMTKCLLVPNWKICGALEREQSASKKRQCRRANKEVIENMKSMSYGTISLSLTPFAPAPDPKCNDIEVSVSSAWGCKTTIIT